MKLFALHRNELINYLTLREDETGRFIITGEIVKSLTLKVKDVLMDSSQETKSGYKIEKIIEVRQSKDVEDRNWYHVVCRYEKIDR